jgi:hypothetical protein
LEKFHKLKMRKVTDANRNGEGERLKPCRYLKTVFERAAEIRPDGDWPALLPWNLCP